MKSGNEPNPWLGIPAADYERHMSSPEVDQLSLLSGLFADVLAKFECTSVAVLGAATGNGFEHIDNAKTQFITAIDINPSYLEVLQSRYESKLSGLRLIASDIETLELPTESFNLIFGALVFEYMDPHSVLEKIRSWLKPNGILAVVLQMPVVDKEVITQTGVNSIYRLDPIIQLCDITQFEFDAVSAGFILLSNRIVRSSADKEFCCIYFRKG